MSNQCYHCNEFQNKELFDRIKKDLTELSADLRAAYTFMQEKENDPTSNEFVYAAVIETVAPTFDSNKAKLDNVLVLCGEYEELSDIKHSVETALKYFPVKPDGMTLQESKDYFSDSSMCCLYILEALNDTLFVS